METIYVKTAVQRAKYSDVADLVNSFKPRPAKKSETTRQEKLFISGTKKKKVLQHALLFIPWGLVSRSGKKGGINLDQFTL